LAAQDPDEPFDLYDEHGRPLGRVKPRAAVHRDGDWHRSLHLWVVLAGEPPTVVFQRRGADKDTWPLRVDAAVTGHFRAGDRLADALREAEEEIGLVVTLEETTRLFARQRRERAAGLVDNELQDILVTLRSEPLEALRPNPEELVEVLAVPLSLALALARGERSDVPTQRWTAELERKVGVLSASELVPADDGYYERALVAALAILEGRDVPPFSPANE
jgi:isopentenyldiphosphate isomerase